MKDKIARDEIEMLKRQVKWSDERTCEVRALLCQLRDEHNMLMRHLGLEWYDETVNRSIVTRGIRSIAKEGPRQ